MSLKPRTLAGLTLAFVAAASLTACATRESEAELRAQARLSQPEAEKIALTKAPAGRIVSAELEKEHGVLVWSFDIAVPNTKNITEVQVDANNGRIVGTEIETPAQQAKEAAEDKKSPKR